MTTTGQDIGEAKKFLLEGKLVAIPTETVYGLAGNALNPEAVLKIFETKNRPFFDPVIVHVASWQNVQEYAKEIPTIAVALAEAFWPGPLTLLLQRKNVIQDIVTAGLDRVALRCPNHPLTLSLLKELSFPLAAPSANPFGYISPTRAEHVAAQLGTKISYILDGGPCEVGIESTVLGWEDNQTVIYRSGGITGEQIEQITRHPVTFRQSSSQPQAPGQLKSHYAPGKKTYLGNIEELIRINQGKRIGVLSFQKKYSGNSISNVVLSGSGDLREAARNLFASLRELDSRKIDIVIAEEVPDTGLGRAINDRLRRAAGG